MYVISGFIEFACLFAGPANQYYNYSLLIKNIE
jgi:hypothetical protein